MNTVLITGATSGIGKEAAKKLAADGYEVVFTARNEIKGKETKKEIISFSSNRNVDFYICDLASFESIKELSNHFRENYSILHILVNNAGVWKKKRELSKDGIEYTFAVNYLAPFLLTNLLLDLLIKSSPSRIINVVSALHHGKIRFDDLEFNKDYSGWKAYAHSKLAIILFTRILAEKLKDKNVRVYALHPGMVSTNLARDATFITKTFFRIFGKKPEKGAEGIVYLAESKDVEDLSGEYFAGKKVARSSKESYNMEVAELLWKRSEEYVGMKFNV